MVQKNCCLKKFSEVGSSISLKLSDNNFLSACIMSVNVASIQASRKRPGVMAACADDLVYLITKFEYSLTRNVNFTKDKPRSFIGK